ncbi:probable LAGLIDADG endonuclease (mitochondrion) [Ustilago bromivora]|uniref:Probable LAGLIDADG endonuclease n=1 Tax=Ustilago bromivora TaxID=307758 RepID=A0A1K0HDP3_9BASI|nr:probable LAGLIDADG endonuclease [Ustilago bromivora]
MDYFGCGEVKKYTNKDACVYRIHSYKNLLEKIQPLLLSIHLNTVKQFYVEPTLKAWDIMTKNRVKSNADLEEIVNLVYDMNRGGLKRKVDKATFLSKILKLIPL